MSAEIHSLAGAYVLDAVDDLERAAFDRHLRDCPDCRTETDELREAAARLADGAWSVPPPGLRAKVLDEVARTRQTGERGAVVPKKPGVVRRRLAVAAAVVVAASTAGSAVFVVQDQRVRDERAAARAARDSEARVRAILAAPDLVLREGPVTGGGRVTVASSRLQDAGVIMLAAGRAPADGRVYQLWSVWSGGRAVDEGVLAAGQSAAVQVVEGLAAADAVGVSVEPAGGSAQPTQPTVAGVKI